MGYTYDNAYADETLVTKAREGDANALDLLMRQFKNLVKSKATAYYLSGGDRDDLIQEGMIGLFKAVRDYDPRKNNNFPAFANLCVNRQILSAVKASARMKHTPLNQSLSLSEPVEAGRSGHTYGDMLSAGKANDPETLLIGRETLNDIDSTLRERLSNMEYHVLTLYLQGCGHADIAQALHKNIKSVDNTLQRIRRKAGPAVSSRMVNSNSS